MHAASIFGDVSDLGAVIALVIADAVDVIDVIFGGGT